MVAIRSLTTILTYAICLCGLIPLFPWLTTAPRVFLVLGLLSGVLQERRGAWPVKPWMQNIAIVPVFIYYALQFSYSNPIEPVVSVLAIMLAVRLSGEKTLRHSFQIHALSLFCLASSSLFDLSPLFLIYLGLLMFLVAIALVLMTFVNQDGAICLSMSDLRRVLIAGLMMPLLSLPLMLFFFPVLPRTQLPLWNYLASTAGLKSGLSDKVEPGSQSSVGESSVLVFRAEMPRQSQQLYWRGTVFNRIEGNRWVRDPAVPAEARIFSRQTVTQTIYPEPTDSKVLIALDRPSAISIKWLKRLPDGVFEYLGSTRRRMNYSAESAVEGVFGSGSPIDKSFYLRLPAGIPQRIQKLAADIRFSGKSDRDRLELLETYFRNGGYRYSTRELPTGDYAVERFLFETRRGNCEFFASAFATLLRSVGVPCRLVGGFLGGDYNELGGYYLVSESMAHVWVEAFIDGSGWLRIDPSTFAENAGNIFGPHDSRNLMLRMRLVFDAINHVWNRTVITYDFEQQIGFVRYAEKRLQSIDKVETISIIATCMAVILAFLGVAFAARRKLFFRSREEKILQTFLLQAERDSGSVAGRVRKGLFEIAKESGSEKMMEFVHIYAGAVYRDRVLTDEEYRLLRKMVRSGFAEVPK
jgi:transglutaminase-like putative cysteine protease